MIFWCFQGVRKWNFSVKRVNVWKNLSLYMKVIILRSKYSVGNKIVFNGRVHLYDIAALATDIQVINLLSLHLRWCFTDSKWMRSVNEWGNCYCIFMTYTYALLHLLRKTLHGKRSFLLRISSVNVTKSSVTSVFCGFGHNYWRNP